MTIGSAADKALVGAAATSPWWVQFLENLETYGGKVIVTCGIIIGLCRAYIAIRDAIDRRNGKRDN